MKKKALLALEDGTVFHGYSTANDSIVCAEIVFNTAMTGYQEVWTDPPYANPMDAFTTSLFGSYNEYFPSTSLSNTLEAIPHYEIIEKLPTRQEKTFTVNQ